MRNIGPWILLLILALLAAVAIWIPTFCDGKETAPPAGWEHWKTIDATVRAYDPGKCCCGSFADGQTSLLDDAYVLDGAAVAFCVIPKRTRMQIPGAGYKEADDTGPSPRRAARRGKYYIEIRVRSHKEALEWGRKKLAVRLYKRKLEGGEKI